MARWIQALDAELEALMNDLDALTKAPCSGLRRSYGICFDGGAVLLLAVGDKPERIGSEAAFAAICCASPLDARQTASPLEPRRRPPGQCHHASHRGGEIAMA